MLVLSRREEQKICFPEFGITVQILRVSSGRVKVGVDAPSEVRIFREEVADASLLRKPLNVSALSKLLRHEVRNELNRLSVAVHLFNEENKAGQTENAGKTFAQITQIMDQLSKNPALRSVPDTPSPKPQPTSSEAVVALVVDDDDNEREMLAGFLRLHGYQTETASNGHEAIAYLKSNPRPAIVLADMGMPRCDGKTMIRRIREDPSMNDLRIFAISGSTPQEAQFSESEDVVDSWFMKPLNPQSLVEAMAQSTVV